MSETGHSAMEPARLGRPDAARIEQPRLVPPDAARIDVRDIGQPPVDPAEPERPRLLQCGRILLIGEPALRQRCRPIDNFATPGLRRDCAGLAATLEHFRATHGFGRAIAAPQAGISRRIVALNLGTGPFVILNPEITQRSEETFTLWDDCMSFPWLLVKVRRHRSISLRYADPAGEVHTAAGLDPATSELLQHELDHLDGILALDRALDSQSIIAREVYEADRAGHDSQVDYSITGGVR